MGKPRGIRTARKMRNRRREQRWADLGYKKVTSRLFNSLTVTSIPRRTLELPWKPTLLEVLPTPKESSLTRSVSRPNSRTPPFESASEFSSSRTERRSLPSSPMMDASTTSKRTTRYWFVFSLFCYDFRFRFWSLVSVDPVTPSVIFPVSDSRLSRSLTSLSWHSSRARRKDQDHKWFLLCSIKAYDWFSK